MDKKILFNIKTAFHRLNLNYCDQNTTPQDSYTILTRTHIKLLTYNLFQVPKVASLFHPAPYSVERLIEFTKHFDDFDIMCFQECWAFTQEIKERLIAYAKKAGFFFYKESPAPGFFSWYFGDGGLLILSRFEIVDWEFMPFQYGVFIDGLTQRGTLYAKIKLKNKVFVNVFDLHTNSSTAFPFPKIMKKTVECRKEQMEQMISMVNQKIENNQNKNESNIYLIVGDFNLSSSKINDQLRDMILKFKPEYEYLIDIFDEEYNQFISTLEGKEGKESVIDYGKLHNDNKPPITIKGGGSIYKNKQSKMPEINMCLDYIIEKVANGDKKKIKVKEGSCKVEKFEVEEEGKQFTQISDHYGVSIELIVIEEDNDDNRQFSEL